jgi:hypothetical protein
MAQELGSRVGRDRAYDLQQREGADEFDAVHQPGEENRRPVASSQIKAPQRAPADGTPCHAHPGTDRPA